jgi:hypothetical protein
MFGSSAAMVGRSKATTAPSTVTAARMPAGVSHCRHRLDQLADKPDAPPVEPVGDMTDDEGQHRHRQELAEADEAERKGAVRLIVDHPSHGNANGLEGERGKNAGGSEVQIAGVAKNAPRSLGYVHCDVTGRLRSRQPL